MTNYILQLRSAHRAKRQEKNVLEGGDIVIIHNLRRPKTVWKLGWISEINVGRDSYVCSCEVKREEDKSGDVYNCWIYSSSLVAPLGTQAVEYLQQLPKSQTRSTEEDDSQHFLSFFLICFRTVRKRVLLINLLHTPLWRSMANTYNSGLSFSRRFTEWTTLFSSYTV